MVAASAAFTINGTPVTSGVVTVSPSSTVNLALISTVAVNTVTWECVGTHEAATSPASITALISEAGSPPGITASFTMPAGATGQGYRLQCTVVGTDGRTATATGLVGATNAFSRIPFVAGERLERQPTQGWTDAMNTFVGVAPLSAPTDPGNDFYFTVANSGDLIYTPYVRLNSINGGLIVGFGGSDPNLGDLRFSESSTAYFHDGTTTKKLLAFDTSKAILGEDSLATIEYRVSTTHAFYVAGASQLALTATSADFQDNNIVTTGDLSVGTGALPGSGAIRVAENGLIRGYGSSANRDIASIVGPDLILGNNTSVTDIELRASTDVLIYVASGLKALWAADRAKLYVSNYEFDDSVATPTIYQETDTTASVTGQTMLIHPQDCTGATTIGAKLQIRPGTGTTSGGAFELKRADGTIQIEIDDTGLGFFAATPVAKPTVTGSKGGNAALTSLMTGLANLGLVTDSTT